MYLPMNALNDSGTRQGLLQTALSGGVLIALTSGLAYLVVYTYDVGFCSYFRMPFDLIVVSPTNVTIVGVVFLCIGYFFQPYTELASMVYRRLGSRWSLAPLNGLSFVFVGLSIIMHWPLAVLLGSVASALYGVYAFRREVSGELPKPKVPGALVSFELAESTAGVILILLVILGVSFGAGRVSAKFTN